MRFLRTYKRSIATFLLFTILIGLVPNKSYALTSGPTQPETQQFAPAGMDNMVDPFTGDFSYNIPLMDVGGYPINLNYAGGITPDAEASWVGLGWNLNVGAINRSVRGLPDDFAGDEVVKEYNVKPNQTVGLNGYIQPELWGLDGLKPFKIRLNASLFYNNYHGFGMTVGMNPSLSSSLGSKSGLTANLGLNLSVGSEDGVGITPSLGLSQKSKTSDVENTLSGTLSFPFSSREGLKGMSLSASYGHEQQKKNAAGDKTTSGTNSSGSAFMGFAVPAYTPFIQNNTYSVNASGDLGVAFLSNSIFEPDFGVSVFYNGQFLNETKRVTNGFGYMHTGLANTYPEENRLMDFNREKEGGGFNKFTVAMPLANQTYDIFQVSGQGIGGTYRAYRGDVGTVSDMSVRDFSVSPEGGVELSIGAAPQPTTKFGAHLKCNVSQSYSGTWQNGGNPLKYQSEPEKNSLQEQVYFKKVGEMSPETDADFLNNGQFGYNLVNNELYDVAGGWLTNRYYVDNNKSNVVPLTKAKRNTRQPMNTRFTTLSANQVNYGIYNYQLNSTQNLDAVTNQPNKVSTGDQKVIYPYSTLNRVDNNRKEHHISEVRVTDNSGARYVYGIPVYNNTQEEVTFALNNKNKSQSILDGYRSTGLAPYDKADVGTGNQNGLDHFFSKTTTPGHATSYLLTEILSGDYVDSDYIPGPSDGDLGNYTKFNYSRTSSDFKWRTPFQQGLCSFNDGMYGTTNDDKGSYVYGEKEIWYLHSIETRTHVAEFYLEDREDGLGVVDRNGGGDLSKDRRLKKLSKIVLYSKQDKLNGRNEPLKTVYFSYDYTLCPNTPNSIATDTKGKLTLKKVWFTYGYSQKGVLNPYVFSYAENFNGDGAVNLNPSYGIKNYDGWGNYKPEGSSGIGNEVFPYTDQDKTKADQYVASYTLSSIKTPTGGTIRVYFESDDYAYVQNKQAMEMQKIVGASQGDINDISQMDNNNNKKLYVLGAGSSDYLIIKLNKEFVPSINATTSALINQEFQQRYLTNTTGQDLMYFKMKMKVLNLEGRYEFVPGYAKIDNGVCHPVLSNGKYLYGLIKLVPVGATPKGGQMVNSVVRTGLSYLRLHLNREAFDSGNADDDGVEQVLGSMLSIMQNIVSFITGFTNLMLTKGNCSEFDPSNSYVRLNSPDKMKLGGGHRVKAIVMMDNWDLMKSKKESTTNLPVKEKAYYGQFYDYTTTEDTGLKDVNGKAITRKISSGVAAYEPQLGGDENPFRQPLYVTETALLAPSKEYYLEEPFGESFFPGPTVGYSKIKTTPMKVTESDLISKNFVGNGSGYVEQQFYTAKDFPTIVKKSDLTTPRYATPLKVDFLVSLSTEKVTTTQGYYIECNDMHGKEKSKKVMPDPKIVSGQVIESEPISYVEYSYKTDVNGKLNNKVHYVNKDLSVQNDGVEMGIDIDVTMDERFSSNSIKGGGAEVNPKGTLPALPLPVVLFGFTVIPSWVDNYSEFKSIVTTKVVTRHGILEKTIAKDNGQTITTQNLAWDKETGQVLLTRVENEFHDPIWNFTYPGHWAYRMMGLAYQNEGIVVDNLNAIINGSYYPPQDGDEWLVKISGSTNAVPIFVNNTSNGFELRSKDGTVLQASTTIEFAKLYRSGLRNIAQTPVGSISVLDDPIAAGNGSMLDFTKVRVLNAGATQFKSDWKVFCNCGENNTNANPFVIGKKGNIRPWRSWTYLTNRQLDRTNGQVNIRKDGYFTDFKTFWGYNASTQLLDTSEISNRDLTKWQYVTEIQNYNPVGMEIENRDALGRFSMAQFGYGRNLPVATSNNSRYQETGFDSFEDYDYGDCKDDHFSWRGQSSNLSQREAHTGRKSIKVQGGKTLLINKIINPCGTTGQ